VHTVLQKGRKVRIFVVVDLCTREIPILYADYSISGEVLVRRLELLNEIRDIPENFVFDNGPEFRSRSMSDWAEKVGLKLCFIEPGKPTQNAFVESLNGKLRNEFLNNNWFYSLAELREALVDWRLNYNTDRPHSSLGYVPPRSLDERCLKNFRALTFELSEKWGQVRAQQTMYRAFARTGRKLTWEIIERIESEALMRGARPGGLNEEIARKAVAEAVTFLKNAGIEGPTRIPWGN